MPHSPPAMQVGEKNEERWWRSVGEEKAGQTKTEESTRKERRERENGKKTRKDEEKKISLIYKSDSDEVFFARTIFIFI